MTTTPFNFPRRDHAVRWLADRLGVDIHTLRFLYGNVDVLYRSYVDTSRGKPRPIDDPDPRLKGVQRRIHVRFLAPRCCNPMLHGAIRGRSAFTNAAVHLNQPCLVTRRCPVHC
jgi:hypothetical protein